MKMRYRVKEFVFGSPADLFIDVSGALFLHP